MKVLFAVNNDNVSEAIAKKYEKQYKDILSYKNVYYFNAIIRELQKDKSYNRVVISEDLEPFANNNYDMIDKFLLEKYSNISREAKTINNQRIEIILLCADRRKQSEDMLVKIYNLEIYNAIIGQDRSIDEVCKLIYGPRDKGIAKQYYDIPTNELSGQEDGDNNVSEAEVENILAHYKKLGKNEDKYVDSFNNIISQYTDTQLKIIIRYLPIHVKAVLEEKSPKYQQLVTSGLPGQNVNFDLKANKYKQKMQKKGFRKKQEENDDDIKETLINSDFTQPKLTQPIVIPSDINTDNVQKINSQKMTMQNQNNMFKDSIQQTQGKAEFEDMNNRKTPIQNIQEQSRPIETNTISDLEDEKPEQINLQQNYQETKKINNQANPEPEIDLFDELLNSVDEETTEKKETIPEATIQQVTVPEIKPVPIQQITTGEEQSPDSTETTIEQIQQPVKRGRGRPRTKPVVPVDPNKPKRGRGRPKKQETIVSEDNIMPTQEANEVIQEEVDLFDMSEEANRNQVNQDLNNISSNDTFSANQPANNQSEDIDLFNIGDEEGDDSGLDLFDISNETESEKTTNSNNIETETFTSADEVQDYEQQPYEYVQTDNEEQNNNYESPIDLFDIDNNTMNVEESDDIATTNRTNTYSNLNRLLTSDKKIVAFVGTTKNGTSFVVNNTAEMLASMGISTAILDMTKSKNSYYIYTNNEEELRNIAARCMSNLENGVTEGLKANKNLTVYAEMPGEEVNYNIDNVLSTLVQNYSAVLIDTDFDTPIEIFERVQEIYLVQTMDVLTIQPLTAFLRNLKSKNVLQQEKLKIVINKSQKIRSLNVKTLIGGMSCYNAPNMSYMTELFDKDNIRYCEIPFETQNYVKYLESLANCSISLSGYTKTLLVSLKELANIVYPLVGKQAYSPMNGNRKDPFSKQMSSTLNKMKNKRY